MIARLPLALTIGMAWSVGAQDSSSTEPRRASPTVTAPATWEALILGVQSTVIAQHLRPFRSPYSGQNSLIATGDDAISHTYGVYVGARLGGHLQGYLDVEMARGKGVGHAVGLGGPTNGDVIRQGTADLGNGPYVARGFLRYSIPLSTASLDTVERGPDQLPGAVPSHRVDITAGKFAVSDLFDANRYANSTRTQFMDWGLFQNTAWDFAADTRGYTNGVVVQWVTPHWTVRGGSFQMPTQANGNKLDPELDKARGDNIEVALSPGERLPIIRVLAFLNHARMGIYANALDAARLTGSVPSIVADDRPGRRKVGVGVNVEQPIADSGDTGAFLRLGWNDGRTESFAFAEVEQHASAGVQISGGHWRRGDDRLGVAMLVDGLSSIHREYLAAGGSGFLLGDGRLRYAREQIGESYYSFQLTGCLALGPDVQVIRNPGYNRDRGPAATLSLRARIAC